MPIRMLSFLAVLLAARPAAADDVQLPLRYGFERSIVRGVRLELSPGIVVQKDDAGTRVIGYTGYLKLKAHRELVIVKSEAESIADGDRTLTRWSVGVHLGGELEPKKIAKQAMGSAKGWVRKVL